jgi:hypothetical protein
VAEVSGRTRESSVQQWAFPAIEDGASNTTISGSSTRTYPEGFGVGPGQPPKAITTATCTWSFTRGVEQISANLTATPGELAGGRGRAPLSNATVSIPQARVYSDWIFWPWPRDAYHVARLYGDWILRSWRGDACCVAHIYGEWLHRHRRRGIGRFAQDRCAWIHGGWFGACDRATAVSKQPAREHSGGLI